LGNAFLEAAFPKERHFGKRFLEIGFLGKT